METAKQEDPNKARLLEITNGISEECWLRMDKYLCAGFAMIGHEFGKLDGNTFYPALNEAKTLVLGADYAALFIKAVAEYERYYKEIIAKAKQLQDAPFLAVPAKRQANSVDVSAFKWLAEQRFADEQAAKAFASYYEIAKNVTELDVSKLTKLPHKRFLPAIKKISEEMQAASAVGKLTKVELSETPKSAPSGVEVVRSGNQQTEERASDAVVPDNVKRDVANLTKMMASLKDNPENVQQKFQNLKQAQTAMDKSVAKFLQAKNDGDFKKAATFIKKMGGQVLPTLWCLSTLTGLRNDVNSVFESIVQSELLELLVERRGKMKRKKPAIQKTQNDPIEKPDETQPDAQTADNAATDEIEELLNQVDALLKISKSTDFATKYEDWTKHVESAVKNSDLAEKLKDKDPYEQLLSLYELQKQKTAENAAANESCTHSFMKRLDERFQNWQL